ncbi:MAG: CoA transferase, partial [Candidatus Sedimenticola endophacoides]
VLEQMAFTPAITPDLKTMDGRIFRAQPMNLATDA